MPKKEDLVNIENQYIKKIRLGFFNPNIDDC